MLLALVTGAYNPYKEVFFPFLLVKVLSWYLRGLLGSLDLCLCP
jgi:hypothetical protein